jgi:diguanylate cyclase (GGDEF)-like protein
MLDGNQMGALTPFAAQSADPFDQLNLRILKLENRLQRERVARLKAEEIAEKGLRDLYEKQQQVALLETIARAANQSSSIDETMRFALDAICRHTGWGFGNVYLPSATTPDYLAPAGIWHASDPAHLEAFICLTLKTGFAIGEGLPGRVYQSGKPAWIADLSVDRNFPRAVVATLAGCRAAFAFPVLVGNDVLGVLEFFHHHVVSPDDQFLGVLAQIGTQLGRVVERRRAEQKLMHDATHDPLTGLPNRLLFSDRLERAVATHLRRPNIGFAVIFIDLDRFKLVNDSLGHSAGDILLQEIARRFSQALIESGHKLASEAVTLARLGGDEFTILLEDIERSSIAVDVAQSLQDSLRNPLFIDGQELYSSASIGVATSEAGYTCAADIMRDADLAMYRAKAEGRARVEIFNQSLHVEARRRLMLESDLRNALRKEEFVLHYQPIIALKSREVTGFEALVRWQKGEGPIIPPSDFIPVAEETGLIVFIGSWVLEQSLKTLAKWQRDFPRAKPLTMSVNVSPRQFHQTDFVEQVIEAVTTSGVPPHTLRLEITESVTIQNAQHAIGILQRLRQFGVRVSIDDFGTGYSSLSYLHQLPFDTLKIDRSFVSALQSRSDGGQIVQTILDLAKNLNLDVVAEGTESEEHVNILHEMGCGFAQGYFFSRPLNETAAIEMLSARVVEAEVEALPPLPANG